MGSSLYLSMIMNLLCFHLLLMITSSSSSQHPLCHDEESSALWQFKQSFVIDEYASFNPSSYPKTASWKLNESSISDCCSWDGVKCDENTGHVIGLDVSSSFLYGSINSTSSLFSLVHLQMLNLADNHFNHSQIPSRFGQLSRLTYLNLSQSVFSGQIPTTILNLSNLASLDLSLNEDATSRSLLKLIKPDLNNLLRNLTGLKQLHLTYVNISSTVPDLLGNFSSLTSLLLKDCGLLGEFPTAIFQLPNLQALDVGSNSYLTGYLPEFNRSCPLKVLKVDSTSFSGELPNSIGNLNSLKELDISNCNFSGFVPSSLGNITQLTKLDLSFNNFNSFSGGNLAWLGKQTKLTYLSLAKTNFIGDIPLFLGNLTQLSILLLHSNQLTGQIPTWLANLTLLTQLNLEENKLNGPIPPSIYKLVNLEILDLYLNNLSGIVEFDKFLNFKNLVELQLSENNFSILLSKTGINASTLPKFQVLELASCNLSEFPDFLRYQDELEVLELSKNRIHGRIPNWVWSIGKETLLFMSVSYNLLTGFNQLPLVLPWKRLWFFNLNSNLLQGPLPIPPPSTLSYLVSNNSLAGEISPSFCNSTSLYALDLSNNNLSGMLPQCLGNFSNSLSVLNLRKNNFNGFIPQNYMKGSELRMIDLSQNQLQGHVPKSLVNCKMLEIIDLGKNRINDTFPFWLGISPELSVLILRSNEFYGAIRSPKTKFEFSKLRIIDLSYNNFTGKLPSEYFKNWEAMDIVNVDHLTYMQSNASFEKRGIMGASENYNYSVTMTNKGIEMSYEKIPEMFKAIDLSSNKFEGEIPESIGNLRGLHLLNLSNNIFIGRIPSCLGNLTELESLDLSQNKLSGTIPQQLIGLTFLNFLNVSHNHLMGPIPQGKQFNTFQNNSFEGNSELCGNPLSKKCENSEASPPPLLSSEQEKDSNFPSGYDWIFIIAGYGSGLVVGFIIGHIVTTKKHEWFVVTFGRKPQKRQREKKSGRRNRT